MCDLYMGLEILRLHLVVLWKFNLQRYVFWDPTKSVWLCNSLNSCIFKAISCNIVCYMISEYVSISNSEKNVLQNFYNFGFECRTQWSTNSEYGVQVWVRVRKKFYNLGARSYFLQKGDNNWILKIFNGDLWICFIFNSDAVKSFLLVWNCSSCELCDHLVSWFSMVL